MFRVLELRGVGGEQFVEEAERLHRLSRRVLRHHGGLCCMGGFSGGSEHGDLHRNRHSGRKYGPGIQMRCLLLHLRLCRRIYRCGCLCGSAAQRVQEVRRPNWANEGGLLEREGVGRVPGYLVHHSHTGLEPALASSGLLARRMGSGCCGDLHELLREGHLRRPLQPSGHSVRVVKPPRLLRPQDRMLLHRGADHRRLGGLRCLRLREAAEGLSQHGLHRDQACVLCAEGDDSGGLLHRYGLLHGARHRSRQARALE
mmetsp:Transcript_26169/g.55404  ORF Transcript_26169/g.55404 Transcript_26169/m.55404 type:complete len:257 (-) Transcript_26169:406-1176(-)